LSLSALQYAATERERIRADVADENGLLMRRFFNVQLRIDAHEAAGDIPTSADITEKELLVADIEKNNRQVRKASRQVYYRQSVLAHVHLADSVLAKRAKTATADAPKSE
jgi:hypothetical protein